MLYVDFGVCFVVCCHREETEPKSAPKETTLRPRKRKADVAIVSSVKRLSADLTLVSAVVAIGCC